jgi:hypothetical protein
MDKKYVIVFDDGRKNVHVKAENILKALEGVGEIDKVTMISLSAPKKTSHSSVVDPDDPFDTPPTQF